MISTDDLLVNACDSERLEREECHKDLACSGQADEIENNRIIVGRPLGFVEAGHAMAEHCHVVVCESSIVGSLDYTRVHHCLSFLIPENQLSHKAIPIGGKDMRRGQIG